MNMVEKNQKIHILFFIHSLAGGGAERVTVSLANYWAGNGWRVTVVTLADTSHDAYDLDPRVRRVSLGLSKKSPSLARALLNNLQRVLALRRCLRQERPDVALAMMTTANCLLALAGRQSAKKILGSERNYPPLSPLGRFWQTLRRYGYFRLDNIVALTNETKSWLGKHTNARKITVIPNPVPFPFPTNIPIVSPTDCLRPQQKTLLAAGRFVPQKAFDRLLNAFAELAPNFTDWDLVIVGDGPLQTEMKQLAVDLGIEDRVIMPGRVGNIDDWYAAADLFVMTSLFEGFGNVIVEAMAHGLPAVSVDCDAGPRDIIRNGVDGVLVPQDEPAALVAALRKLMTSQSLRQKYAKRAVEIRERLALEPIAHQWEILF